MTDPASIDDVPDFGLMSEEAETQLKQVVADVTAQAKAGEINRGEALVMLGDAYLDICIEAPEANDAPVRSLVVGALDPVFGDQGWEKLDPFEF